ncbi:MAG: HEAT repeat domain-containing protein, partial [Cyanobacteria bacterium K_DeepCast_35m_m2_023]|nr:HEAT repeat domain-containing protein [Cyanobacteria bacterium K_DeepCast_35m_m2_023]
MSTITPLIAAVQQAGSALELLRATAALAASGDSAAAPTLVEVLGFNNPGAAVAAVDGLIAIGTPAVEPLLQLDPRNYGARAWAVRALAGIGDVRGLDLLIEALRDDVGPSVRCAAAKGLGSLKLQALDADERAAIEQRCLEALLEGYRDGEWVVRYAVTVGLEGLALGGGWPDSHPPHGRACEALRQRSDHRHEDARVVRL